MAHEPAELLLRRGRLLTSCRHLRVISVANTCAARMVERVDRARLGELSGELGGPARRCPGCGKGRQDLARGDRADIGLPRVGGDTQRILRGAQLGLLDATPAILERVGQVASDSTLATTFRSISSSIEVETSSKEKIGSGGRLDCTATASAMPSRL